MEWLWVDSNSTNGKSTFCRRANLSWLSAICIHLEEIAAWSRKLLTTFKQQLTFLEKKTRYRQIFKNVFQNDSPSVRSTSCVQISWNLADRKSVKSCVIYVTKKNKISARSPALASARIAPKICQGQLQTIYSEYPKFHPNPFTSGGVIAGRVNIVETRRKVFPILGEATASSPSNKVLCCASVCAKECDLPSSRLAHQALLVTINPSSALHECRRLGVLSLEADILPYGGNAIAPPQTNYTNSCLLS